DVHQYELSQLSFLNKLFLLAILDNQIHEHSQHAEYIDWDQIKYHPISPNYLMQNALIKRMSKENILSLKDFNTEFQHYYINVRLDGYAEPSLFSITQQLRHWFFENLSKGVPFKSAEEVKDVLYLMLYQEIIQFAQ